MCDRCVVSVTGVYVCVTGVLCVKGSACEYQVCVCDRCVCVKQVCM